MSAHPLTSNGGVIELRTPITSALTPGANAPNGWFWNDTEARNGRRSGALRQLLVRFLETRFLDLSAVHLRSKRLVI